MPNSGLYRFAVTVAVCAFLLVATGAVVTSAQLAQEVPAFLRQIHMAVAGLTGLLTIGLAASLARLKDRPALPKLGWSAVALVVLQAALGMWAPSAGFVHAVLAQIFFAVTVAMAAMTSASWCGERETIEDQMRPPMNTLARLTVGFVIVQVILGAAVRHKVMNVMSHIGFAVIVALVALMLGMCILHQAPKHRILRSAAITLMSIVGVQVFLGFTAFIVKLMASETSTVVTVSTVTHVSVGALVLGATVLAMLQVQRYVVRAAELHGAARPTTAG